MAERKDLIFHLLTNLLLCLMLVVIWFHKGYLFAGGEEGIPFHNLGRTLSLYFAWGGTGGGYLNQEVIPRIGMFALLKFLNDNGFPGVLVQAATFFFLMLTATFSMYLLLRQTVVDSKFLKKNTLYKHVPLIGAIFYLLNPFSMIQIWGRGLYSQFFPFALFPLLLLLIVLGLKKRNIIFGFIFLISSLIFSPAFSNLSYVMSLWFLIIFYFLFYVSQNKKEIKFAFFFFFYLLLGFIVVHFWWIYFYATTLSQVATIRSLNLEHDLGTLQGVSRTYSLFTVLQLLHHFLTKAEYYGRIYYTIPFKLLGLIIPVSFLLSFGIFKRLKSFKFYLILFLLSFFIVLGSNLPLGWLFVMLFKIFTPLRAFRNPYEKMGLVFLIAYTPFVSIGLINLSKKIRNILKGQKTFKKISQASILITIVFLTCGVYLWPMWLGKFAGGLKYNPWIRVPDYYKEANDWMNAKQSDFKVLHLPLNPGDGARYLWDRGIYQGVDPNMFLFDKYTISIHFGYNKPFYNVLLERFNILQEGFYGPDPDVSQSEFRGNTFREELEKLNVRFIVLHHDLDHEFSKSLSPQEFAYYLSKQEGIKKAASFGKLDIYQVENDPKVDLIYSTDEDVSFERVGPGVYNITVEKADNPFDIYFLENFDNNWKAFTDGEEVYEHKKVFSYANSWRIDKKGSFMVELEYEPQKSIAKGAQVSIAGIITLTLFSLLAFALIKKKVSSIRNKQYEK